MKTIRKVLIEFLTACKLAVRWRAPFRKVWRFVRADYVLQKEIQNQLESHKFSKPIVVDNEAKGEKKEESR